MTLDDMSASKKYAKAMFEVLSDSNELESGYADLLELRKIFAANPRLIEILDDIRVSDDEKKSLLAPITQNASDFINNFLKVVASYRRFPQVLSIIDQFQKVYEDDKKIVRAQVVSATPLDDDQLDRLAKAFEKRVGAVKAIFDTKVDKSLIGGIVIRSSDVIIDGSVQTRINKVKELLLN
ncbi:ATP synthase F1 subunit delta [Lentilactobacillus buchneri]|uniref:ATP synthase subunit delta n=1 Tax=Lentilactobacillus buchneri DSM 20057 TaxID=1423728 RepID=A0A4R5NUE0_LENBU|nr:ATP synthase F1 subunit delta [Lentilactobacillus buchneri]WCJ51578.1 ATP synthase F1 subunit delta [Lentilactobacillus sp. Egmn17]AEB73122.1 ATP synthase subunit delta [Lentilactobacillus buchneri NRRL B-30929]KRK68330.1 ATP synthase subunit delta [Lentilactobacillus buchneri DSM 20057]MCT2882183.1 F0F1 ATP synthase subunit delta [Lentilactobacillus buchneri]MCT2899629.1 F0F1 ATP synthase subunit delta [Lentilactobacillus buchneri]